MNYSLLYIVAPTAVSFLLQSVLCHKVKKGILRHGTLILPVIAVGIGVVTLLTQYGDIFGGLGAVAAILWFVIAFCAIFGYGAAWLVSFIIKKREK